MHAQWSDDFHHSLHAVLTGEKTGYHRDFGSMADLAKSLKQAFVYDGRFSSFRDRRHGRPIRMLNGHNFLAYLQNHDQVGNRARGDRSGHLLGTRRLKIAAALVLTSPFIPMLFQGEEWGASTPFQYFTDHQDPELGKAVSKGRQEEFSSFGWDPEEIPDPQAVETFERSKLKWAERESEPHRSVLEWHKRIVRLRRTIPDLTDGRLDRIHTGFDEEKKWFWVQRGEVTVVCNLASHAQQVSIPCLRGTVLLASDSNVEISDGIVSLPADSVAILGAKEGKELAFHHSVR